MFARSLALCLALIAALAVPLRPASAQTAEARFAFVIGNDGYEGAPLPTAANDAGLVAETLKQAGFDVTGARNLDQDTLRASFREFLDKVAAAGPTTVAAVYLSGYGLQVDGENYLVPPGARVQRDSDVSLNAVRLSDLLRALSGLPSKARIVMLDLAYDGPFGKAGQPLAPGLELMDAPPDTLIAFNAAPGTWAPKPSGDYGAYARALSETMRIPGLPMADLFARVRTRTAELTQGKQVPWDASRIDPDFRLLERGANAPAAEVSEQALKTARTRPIHDFDEADAYAAALDRDTITGYQDFLTSFPRSRYAGAVRGLLAARREALTWRRTTAVNTPNAFWSYLKRYPKGPHAADARRRLSRLSAALEPPARFDSIEYDVAPPPDAEIVYFERPEPVYFEDALPPPRAPFMPPPPAWWTPPPPPPEDVYEETYFLPTPVAPPPPAWARPPAYVVDAPDFHRAEHHREGGGPNIVPYVAIPAALAAGIAAGKLIDHARRPRPTGAPPPAGGPRPDGVRPGFVPPVTQPPRSLTQIQQQQQQQGQPGQGLPPGRPRPPGVGAPQQPGTPPPVQTRPTLPAQGQPQPNQLPQGQLPQQGRPGPRGLPGPVGLPPATRPGAQAPNPAGQPPQPGRPPQQAQPPRPGQPGQPPQPGLPARPGVPPQPPAAANPQPKLQQLQQQRQQQQQMEQQRQQQLQQQRQQQLQQQQQQRQQQLQQQQQQQQQRQQQLLQQRQQQQRATEQRQQLILQQQRQQQQVQQQRQQQLQQQRQQQLQQQRAQEQQRQQQMMQQRQQQQIQQRQQQMQQQRALEQQRQQQMMQQRQQQQIQQQRQQQMQQMQQRQQQQRPAPQAQPQRGQQRSICGGPGQPPCR